MGEAPHAELGCTGCHQHGPEVERGRAHGFVARMDDPACTRCHALGFKGSTLPELASHHATDGGQTALDTPEGRRRRNARLLAGDRAAWVHNAGYALQLAEGVSPVTPAAQPDRPPRAGRGRPGNLTKGRP